MSDGEGRLLVPLSDLSFVLISFPLPFLSWRESRTNKISVTELLHLMVQRHSLAVVQTQGPAQYYMVRLLAFFYVTDDDGMFMRMPKTDSSDISCIYVFF